MKHVIYQFAVRDLQSRYRGSFLGLGWALLTPIALLLVFTFVFNHLFQVKWPESEWDSTLSFALFTFCGLVVYLAAAETLTRAPSLIYSQPNFVTKVVFPLWVIPVSISITNMVQVVIGLLVLLLTLVFVSELSWSWLALPLILLPFWWFLIGLSLGLAGLGVYVRDLSQAMGLISTLLMFLSPVFYPLSSVSGSAKSLILLNPLTHFMKGLREVLILGVWPSIETLLIIGAWGGAVMLIGVFIFKKLQKGFADVL